MFAKIDSSRFPLIIVDYGEYCTNSEEYEKYLEHFDVFFKNNKNFVLVLNFLDIKETSPSFFFKTLSYLSNKKLSIVKKAYFVTKSKLAASAIKFCPIKRFCVISTRENGIKKAIEFLEKRQDLMKNKPK